MNICFVALSRKRKRYFDLLAQFAPKNVSVTVVFGVRANRFLFFALFTLPWRFPIEQVDIHLRRQHLNYPRLFCLPAIGVIFGFLTRWFESVRLKYYCLFFKSCGFDSIAVWNGQKIPYSAITIAAKTLGLGVWFFENGVLPGTTTIDPLGINAGSSVSRCPADYPRQLLPEIKLPSLDALPVILIPLQVESDTQVILHSPWVRSNLDLVKGVIAALEHANIQARVVIRRHPLSRAPFSYRELPDFASLDSLTPLAEQLHSADLVVTMNSSVGLEALQIGKPVIVTAAALYGVRDVVKRVGSQVQLEAALVEILAGKWRPSRAKSFVSSLVQSYCIVGDWRDLGSRQASHCQRAWLRLTGVDQFAQRRSV